MFFSLSNLVSSIVLKPSRIYICHNLFLVKVLEKRHIIKEKKVPYVSREKEALAMTNHPFIVKLYFTFQDVENLCIFSCFCQVFDM